MDNNESARHLISPLIDHHAISSICVTDSHVSQILSDVELSDSIGDGKFIELRLRLIDFYTVIYTEFDQAYKIGRSELLGSIDAVRNAIRALLSKFEEETPFATALRAAELGLLARQGIDKNRLRLPLALSDLVPALESIDAVAKYLSEEQDRFDKLSPSEKIRWRFDGASRLERTAHEQLYPYLRNRQDDKPEHYAIRMIADIYTWLYDREFGVTTVPDGRPGSEYGLQYKGPAIRFACSIVNRLGLRRVFGVDEPTQSADGSESQTRWKRGKAADVRLANKIGQLWTNDKRRNRPKPRRGWPDDNPRN
ncbi:MULTISPECIES: hypothetical protein [unclassified Mesorhizobium]|uniref:hypothetical protein n=1 Tax=unclassified Mesorhizobium TaxID=325217 RepID=UPI001092F88D|nr:MULTISPECIES: hypothetical protein [unclassified Mesorhizobium]TGQ43676.1 hypothetical protein EN857_06185 [Mesorhizobium sp. M4B.F.Ca.ET.214.01.1.1]TGQ62491.1 hypothetical protein EN854_06190 [Mesorhizobium sp. M4B.F.Ca.ET.211.01.1.1]TGU39693.1 hypothetical protein EN793_06185 [Mesorhizobium sp. M4B.F.Ca.ET.150.01.1.1]TIX14845.1 MAG: hypothetical protein E5V46_07425 [Mesorhizobium sp.]